MEIIESSILQGESIFKLVSIFKNLEKIEEREEFLSVIKLLTLHDSKEIRFRSLTVIEFLEKAHLFEEVIKSNVLDLDFRKDERCISPLLTLCASLSNSWSIAFIKRIIDFYKPNLNEDSYYFDIGIRSIVCTDFWKESLDEIVFALQTYDDIYVIDFIAYFKWENNKKEVKKLYDELNKYPHLGRRIYKLKVEIENRYSYHYKNN